MQLIKAHPIRLNALRSSEVIARELAQFIYRRRLLFILFIFVNAIDTLRSLGALFDVNVNENKQIFQYAIEKANEQLLSGEEFQLEGQVADIVYGNEISVSRGLCGLLEV